MIINIWIGKPLNATDKRQLPAIAQSMTALIQQYNANQISPEILGKLDIMVTALNEKNTAAANAIHMVRLYLFILFYQNTSHYNSHNNNSNDNNRNWLVLVGINTKIGFAV